MSIEAWSALANCVIAIAAVAAAIAAFLGLNTWKNQSLWHADRELSRKILIALYRYRDSLYYVRHPAMLASEMEPDKDQEPVNGSNERNQGVINAYVKRWGKLGVRSNDLDALLIEADAVWGSELSQKLLKLKELERELFGYVRLYLDSHFRGDTSLAASHREILREKRDILFDTLNEEDEFRRDFVDSMKPIEAYLKVKLGRKT
ncbi:MAG: hypothetical protein KUG74_12910 [Rhodobacteraceae bacterium]|nr:hypothetical protein [Paracoccaceae bacterium]